MFKSSSSYFPKSLRFLLGHIKRWNWAGWVRDLTNALVSLTILASADRRVPKCLEAGRRSVNIASACRVKPMILTQFPCNTWQLFQFEQTTEIKLFVLRECHLCSWELCMESFLHNFPFWNKFLLLLELFRAEFCYMLQKPCNFELWIQISISIFRNVIKLHEISQIHF